MTKEIDLGLGWIEKTCADCIFMPENRCRRHPPQIIIITEAANMLGGPRSYQELEYPKCDNGMRVMEACSEFKQINRNSRIKNEIQTT